MLANALPERLSGHHEHPRQKLVGHFFFRMRKRQYLQSSLNESGVSQDSREEEEGAVHITELNNWVKLVWTHLGLRTERTPWSVWLMTAWNQNPFWLVIIFPSIPETKEQKHQSSPQERAKTPERYPQYTSLHLKKEQKHQRDIPSIPVFTSRKS